MADIGTITAANSIYLLAIRGLYPVPQQLVGFSADAAFDTDASEMVEVVKGVDGRMSAGFTPFVTRQTISIMPDSPTSIMFENWISAMKSAREVFPANAVINLPSTNRSYILTNGVLISGISIPGTRKVLQARNFIITWDNIDAVPV